MSAVLKTLLSMSVSGGLLILVLLLGKQVLKDRLSRQWQYYIWLVVLLRLLLPFSLEPSLLGGAYQAADQSIALTAPLPPRQSMLGTLGNISAAGPALDPEPGEPPAEDLTLEELRTLLTTHLWLIWLAAALGLLLRKITVYQGFLHYIRAGAVPVSDLDMLDRLAAAGEQAGVKRPVELCVNPLISSPLLTGFFRPCIVLPSADIPEEDFQYIALHELIHCKRRDMFYKWLVQIAVCLHWFNPLVHLMSREVTRACEFSCDEAVLAIMGRDRAQDYGKTLLDAMAAVGKYRENLGAVTLSEHKQLLKERLNAIMKCKEPSKSVKALTVLLTLCIALGAAFSGVYPAAAAANQAAGGQQAKSPAAQVRPGTNVRDYASQAERYYKAGSLPLFEITFPRLEEGAQKKWLEKLYEDGDFSFFSVAVRRLDEQSSLPGDFAEQAYADEEAAFFSILADRMSEEELELWLDRAMEDGSWAFQSLLFDRLDRREEFDKRKDEQEKEWEAAQKAEYRAAGVTMDGKDYYYRGQLVNIFLDLRANQSCYTLNMNPKGAVSIKIIRNEDNKITAVSYMTEAEAAQLLMDMEDEEDQWENGEGRVWHPRIIPVDLEALAAGERVLLGEYTLSEGDRIWYDLAAESGERMKVFFAGDGQEEAVYWCLNNQRQPGESLECIGDFTVGPPFTAPGAYKLYLQAPEGALGGVKGSVAIGFAAEAD